MPMTPMLMMRGSARSFEAVAERTCTRLYCGAIFTYFNDALCRIFGYDRGEIKGRNFREFMDQENAASAFKRFNHIYQSGDGITHIVWVIIRKDGHKRIIELSANLIVENDGGKAGFRGIARDVTEKNLAQRKALESEELAERDEASCRAEQTLPAIFELSAGSGLCVQHRRQRLLPEPRL